MREYRRIHFSGLRIVWITYFQTQKEKIVWYYGMVLIKQNNIETIKLKSLLFIGCSNKFLANQE